MSQEAKLQPQDVHDLLEQAFADPKMHGVIDQRRQVIQEGPVQTNAFLSVTPDDPPTIDPTNARKKQIKAIFERPDGERQYVQLVLNELASNDAHNNNLD